ncbi:hypothetical protein BGX24_004065 [Mortierella sp. AD032]|nr:hypothetical protein BGX24_004065 [Mortierella sp. AD032]
MLSYTMYTTIDPTTVPPMVNVEQRGRRLHNNNSTSTTSSPSSSTYASDEEDDHIEPLKSNSRRGSILNFVYGLPSNSNSRANSRTRSRSRSRPNIKTHDDPAALLHSLTVAAYASNNNPAAPPSPKQSGNASSTFSSRRSSIEVREDYAELLEERTSRPASRVNSRSNSRAPTPAPHPHSHSHLHHEHVTINDNNKEEKEKKGSCGNDCETCGNCNTIKDTVLELDDNTPGKIQKKFKYPRQKSIEITGPYGSTLEIDDSDDQEAKENGIEAPSSESIERQLGFDMTLLSF